MRFRQNARLDTSQVEDRRGRGGGSSMGLPPVAVGGGGIGIVVLVAFVLLQALSNGGASGSAQTPSDLAATCRSGSDANARDDCRIVGDVNSVQRYWSTALPRYTIAKTVFFTSSTDTGRGGGGGGEGALVFSGA